MLTWRQTLWHAKVVEKIFKRGGVDTQEKQNRKMILKQNQMDNVCTVSKD